MLWTRWLLFLFIVSTFNFKLSTCFVPGCTIRSTAGSSKLCYVHNNCMTKTKTLFSSRPSLISIKAVDESGKSKGKTSRIQSSLVLPYLGVMAASGAALGPFLDGYHSAFGVLAYTSPKALIVGGTQLVVTDNWVPPLFALAAIILGASYVVLDELFNVDAKIRSPSGPYVCSVIGYFCLQYYMSGLLCSQGLELPQLHLFLAVTAALSLAVWDRTLTGATMAVVTGVAGPLVEILLLKGWPALTASVLYHYTQPDLMDAIPAWIAWVYACGAPAVGNLGRAVWAGMTSDRDTDPLR